MNKGTNIAVKIQIVVILTRISCGIVLIKCRIEMDIFLVRSIKATIKDRVFTSKKELLAIVTPLFCSTKGLFFCIRDGTLLLHWNHLIRKK